MTGECEGVFRPSMQSEQRRILLLLVSGSRVSSRHSMPLMARDPVIRCMCERGFGYARENHHYNRRTCVIIKWIPSSPSFLLPSSTRRLTLTLTLMLGTQSSDLRLISTTFPPYLHLCSPCIARTERVAGSASLVDVAWRDVPSQSLFRVGALSSSPPLLLKPIHYTPLDDSRGETIHFSGNRSLDPANKL